MLRQFIGPESKYDDSLPYTYEARVPVIEGEDDYNSYISDTICGLIQYLKDKGINAEEATLYEVYKQDEKIIDKKLCINEGGGWLKRADICKSFKRHYKGHIHQGFRGGCSFQDRAREGSGP